MLNAMIIQHISIQNFGSISVYEAELTPELNFLHSLYTEEITAALHFLLCNKSPPAIPAHWVQDDTKISATICLEEATFIICAKSRLGQLQLAATDPTGSDATAQYQYAMSHCPEQDVTEVFDGQNNKAPSHLFRYYNPNNISELSVATQHLTDTKTFHHYLWHYIRKFQPEPINSKKKYYVGIDSQGQFQVSHPEFTGKIYLSETEQKLFCYICFLHIAEFWANFQKIRDLHHEKKPLLIRNFAEFLDQSADISNLIARTKKLQRQIIFLVKSEV